MPWTATDIDDLDKRLRDQAERTGAEIVIMGDFNEKWKEKGPFQEWAINRGRLTKKFYKGGSGAGRDCTCKGANRQKATCGRTLTGSFARQDSRGRG
jgi:hypothetical protein